jgi:hypothetical protein
MTRRVHNGAAIALFAMLLQIFLPLGAALATPANGDAVVICTADGIKIVRLGEDGQPLDRSGEDGGNAGRTASHCGHCTLGHQGAALVPPAHTTFPTPGRGIALAVPRDGAAAGQAAATPYHTRAPPLSA